MSCLLYVELDRNLQLTKFSQIIQVLGASFMPSDDIDGGSHSNTKQQSYTNEYNELRKLWNKWET